MIDGTYAVEADTPLGRKQGTVQLAGNGPQVSAVARAMGQTLRATGTCDGDAFSFEGELKVMFKTAHYRVEGRVEGDRLVARAHVAGREVPVEGSRKG